MVVLPSGLQYEILKEGTGRRPKATDKVQCHYHGTLIDGTVFDSSVQRGTPAVFGVNQVIAGWVEALQLMPEGSKWRLFIPSVWLMENMGQVTRLAQMPHLYLCRTYKNTLIQKTMKKTAICLWPLLE